MKEPNTKSSKLKRFGATNKFDQHADEAHTFACYFVDTAENCYQGGQFSWFYSLHKFYGASSECLKFLCYFIEISISM